MENDNIDNGSSWHENALRQNNDLALSTTDQALEIHILETYCSSMQDNIKDLKFEVANKSLELQYKQLTLGCLELKVENIAHDISRVNKSIDDKEEMTILLLEKLEYERQKIEEQKQLVNSINKKFDDSYKELQSIYERSPLAQERRQLRIDVQKRKIELAILKQRIEEQRQKNLQMELIKKRMAVIKIIKFAEFMKKYNDKRKSLDLVRENNSSKPLKHLTLEPEKKPENKPSEMEKPKSTGISFDQMLLSSVQFPSSKSFAQFANFSKPRKENAPPSQSTYEIAIALPNKRKYDDIVSKPAPKPTVKSLESASSEKENRPEVTIKNQADSSKTSNVEPEKEIPARRSLNLKPNNEFGGISLTRMLSGKKYDHSPGFFNPHATRRNSRIAAVLQSKPSTAENQSNDTGFTQTLKDLKITENPLPLTPENNPKDKINPKTPIALDLQPNIKKVTDKVDGKTMETVSSYFNQSGSSTTEQMPVVKNQSQSEPISLQSQHTEANEECLTINTSAETNVSQIPNSGQQPSEDLPSENDVEMISPEFNNANVNDDDAQMNTDDNYAMMAYEQEYGAESGHYYDENLVDPSSIRSFTNLAQDNNEQFNISPTSNSSVFSFNVPNVEEKVEENAPAPFGNNVFGAPSNQNEPPENSNNNFMFNFGGGSRKTGNFFNMF